MYKSKFDKLFNQIILEVVSNNQTKLQEKNQSFEEYNAKKYKKYQQSLEKLKSQGMYSGKEINISEIQKKIYAIKEILEENIKKEGSSLYQNNNKKYDDIFAYVGSPDIRSFRLESIDVGDIRPIEKYQLCAKFGGLNSIYDLKKITYFINIYYNKVYSIKLEKYITILDHIDINKTYYHKVENPYAEYNHLIKTFINQDEALSYYTQLLIKQAINEVNYSFAHDYVYKYEIGQKVYAAVLEKWPKDSMFNATANDFITHYGQIKNRHKNEYTKSSSYDILSTDGKLLENVQEYMIGLTKADAINNMLNRFRKYKK